jgi:hypothetical protein
VDFFHKPPLTFIILSQLMVVYYHITNYIAPECIPTILLSVYYTSTAPQMTLFNDILNEPPFFFPHRLYDSPSTHLTTYLTTLISMLYLLSYR